MRGTDTPLVTQLRSQFMPGTSLPGWGSPPTSSSWLTSAVSHDVGKAGLPPGLLEKSGPLTLDERREMQRHSAIGERTLANVDTYAEIPVVRHHHERVDG